MAGMDLDQWLTAMVTDGRGVAGPITIDSALVTELAELLVIDERDLTSTVRALVDVYARTSPAYDTNSGGWYVVLPQAVAKAVISGVVVTSVLRHMGIDGLPADVLSAVAALLFSVQRVEIRTGELVLHARLAGAAGDLETLYRALPRDVRAKLTVDELAVVVKRLRAHRDDDGVAIGATNQRRRIRLVLPESSLEPVADDTPPAQPVPVAPTVFVSYAHDSERHKTDVLEFAELLTRNGIIVQIDQWAGVRRKDWGAWAVGHIETADFVVIVASRAYREAGDGLLTTEAHRGVQSETAFLRDLLHGHRAAWLSKLLPVMLPGHGLDEIPLFLQPHTADRYWVPALTDAGIEELLRALTDQPRYVAPMRGRVPVLPPQPPAPSRQTVGWTVLSEPVDVVWRSTLFDRSGSTPAILEVHLVPHDIERLPVSVLRATADELPTVGRRRGLFTPAEQVDVQWTDHAARATAATTGVAVHRSGQRTAWQPLPQGKIGSVLDQDDVRHRIAELLGLLTELDVPDPSVVVPAIGLEPITLVREAPLSELNSTSGQLHMSRSYEVRVPADERLSWDEVRRSPSAVAKDLAYRLVAAFRDATR